MYSPSKEERIIRTLKSGRKVYSYEQRGREGVEKMMNIQTRWMGIFILATTACHWSIIGCHGNPVLTYYTIGGRNCVSALAWSAILEEELLRLPWLLERVREE